MKRMIGAAALIVATIVACNAANADVRTFSDPPLNITTGSNVDNHVTTMVDDCIGRPGRPGGGGWHASCVSTSEEDECDLTRTDCADLFKRK